jgi:hypothetical protein
LGPLIVPVMLAVLALSVPAAIADPVGQITEFSAGPGSFPHEGIAAGPDGNQWFTDNGETPAIGRVTPSGQITEFSTGLNGAYPEGIMAGPDGNVWFTDEDDAIGRIGSGTAPALDAPASVSGAGQEGSPEACETPWSSWAGYAPSTHLYPFDGSVWLRDGSPIAAPTTPTYTPTAADVGHQIACRATVTYPLPFQLTATATSPAITIRAAPPPPSTPALSALNVSPRTFTLRERRVGGRCQPTTRSNHRHRPCTRGAALTVRFTLSTSATVTLALEQALRGRLTRSRCTARTRIDRRHRRCTRLALLPGAIALAGVAGVNSFTLPGAIGGHTLEPGSYCLLATPTLEGRAGNQRQTTVQITR